MKVLVAAISIAALFNICVSMDTEDPALSAFKEEFDNNDIMTALKQKVEDTMKNPGQWDGEDNEILPADFDEETEKVLSIMDFTDELMRNQTESESTEEDETEYMSSEEMSSEGSKESRDRSRHGKNRGRHGKRPHHKMAKESVKSTMKLLKHHEKMHKNHVYRSLKGPKRCIDMEKRVEMLCSRVKMAKHNPLVEKLYLMVMENSKKAGWNTCCQEDESDRMTCFKNMRTKNLEKACENKDKVKFAECCEAEDRDECIADMKEEFCDEFSSKQSHHRKGGRPHHKRGGKNKHNFDEETFESCCEAGNASSINGNPKQCFNEYMALSEEDDTARDFSCVKGFLSCCINENNDEELVRSVYKKAFVMLKKLKHGSSSSMSSEGDSMSDEDDVESSEDKTLYRGRHRGGKSRSEEDSDSDEKRMGNRGKGRGGKRWRPKTVNDESMRKGKKFDRNVMKKEKKQGRKDARRGRKQRPAAGSSPQEAELAAEEELFMEEEKLIVPDETFQEIEEIMEEEMYDVTFADKDMCCVAGKNTTIALDGVADDEACDLSLTNFESEWPEGAVDVECAQTFMDCCVTVKTMDRKFQRNADRKGRGNHKKERNPGALKDKHGRKMPEGMRMDESGHYYFVDKTPPSWGDKSGRTVKRNGN